MILIQESSRATPVWLIWKYSNGNVTFNELSIFVCQLVRASVSFALLTDRVLIHEVKWIINMQLIVFMQPFTNLT